MLDDSTGGTSVIASGTLGRQEAPGSISDYSEVVRQGQFYVNRTTPQNRRSDPLSPITWYYGDGSASADIDISTAQTQ